MFDGFSEGKSQTNTNNPVLFPPALGRGDFLICQTPAIMRYLGKKFGMYPTNDEDVARADQVMLTALDFITEGSSAFYPPGVEESDTKTIQVPKNPPH
jgi:glutathione S-transferase